GSDASSTNSTQTAVVPPRPTPELAERLRRTRHDLALLRTDFEELRQSCRHCLHSVDQMFTDTLAIVQSQRQSKNLRRDSSPRPHSQERLKAYRLESRAIDTRLFELEQLVEELRSGTLIQQALSRCSAISNCSGCGISDSAASDARRLLQQQKSLGDSAQNSPAKAMLSCQQKLSQKSAWASAKIWYRCRIDWEEYDNVAQSTVDGHPPPLASPSPSPPRASVASAASAVGGVRRAAAANQRDSTVAAAAASAPAPATHVKVDDGSQVIKLNWADASEPAAAAATASAAKSPTSGSPRTPPPPPPRKSSTGGTGVTSSPLGGPGSRQRPSDYENVVGRVRPGSQAEEDAEQVWQRQSTVHFRSRSDSDRHRASGSATAAQLPLWRCNRRSRS
uniref:ING domain-containing protein n=1 Tax=Macrostomum lignano TaxID=282301 RepID=A0A1I8FRQ8_9PLAT